MNKMRRSFEAIARTVNKLFEKIFDSLR